MSASATQLLLMGTPIARAGEVRIHVERRKTRAVLYLLGASEEGVTRAEIADMIWPELTLDRALRALRGVLSELRRTLPNCLVRADRRRVSLEGVACDVRELLTLLRTGGSPAALERVLRSFRGPFLETFSLDTPGFVPWLVAMRGRLDAETRQAFERVLSDLQRQGRDEQALGVAQHFVALRPHDEGAHRAVIGLAARLGRTTQAFEQFESCRKILGERFGIEPGVETRQLVREVNVRHAQDAPPQWTNPPLTDAREPASWQNQDGLAPRSFVQRRARELLSLMQEEPVVVVCGPVGSGLHAVLREVERQPGPGKVPAIVYPPPSGWSAEDLEARIAAIHTAGVPTLIGARSRPNPPLARAESLGVPSPEEVDAWVRRRLEGAELTEIARRRLRWLVEQRGLLASRVARLLDRVEAEELTSDLPLRFLPDPATDAVLLQPLGQQGDSVRALSIFEGAFSPAAAESVSLVSHRVLLELVDWGFVRPVGERFLLEAWARTAELGPEPQSLSQRHARWVAAQPGAADPGDVARAWLSSDPPTLSELAEALLPGLAETSGPVLDRLGDTHFERLFSMVSLSPRLRGLALLAQARWTIQVGAPGAAALLARAHEELVQAGDLAAAVRASLLHAEYAQTLGWVTSARNATLAAASLSRGLGDRELETEVALVRARVTQGDETSDDDAAAVLADALSATRTQSSARRDWVCLEVARHRRRHGDLAAAREALWELLRRGEPPVVVELRLEILIELAEMAVSAGEPERAPGLVNQALDHGLATGRRRLTAKALALWAIGRGAADPRDPAARREFEVAIAALTGLLDHRSAATYLRAWADAEARGHQTSAARSSLGRALQHARLSLSPVLVHDLASQLSAPAETHGAGRRISGPQASRSDAGPPEIKPLVIEDTTG